MQLQADFGEYHAIREGKGRIKLYLVVFVLAYSRYKYVAWQERPFKTVDFVRCLESCFMVFGGIPLELVIDQDSLMTVSENIGDIIFTNEFEHCKNRHGFTVWLCRKADPESKGMVESGVKFVKYNFARNRCFRDIDQWTKDCTAWLERTGNGKVHETTLKIPAEVFAEEQKHLRPITAQILEVCEDIISTPVLKNNTIRYKGVRYTVPFGTYTECKQAVIREAGGSLEIYDHNETLIAVHEMSGIPGSLVRNTNHMRDTSAAIEQLAEEVESALGNAPLARAFIETIRKKKGRYIRDQLFAVLAVAKKYDPEIIRLALLACREGGLDSANDLRDFAEHIFRESALDSVQENTPIRLIKSNPEPVIPEVKVEKRRPDEYMKLIRKGGAENE